MRPPDSIGKLHEKPPFARLAFPDHERFPANLLQFCTLASIAHHVSVELSRPVLLPCARTRGTNTTWVLMPEAPMYEQCNPLARKD